MIVAELAVAVAALLATNVDNLLAVSALFMDTCFQARNVAAGFLLATAAVVALSLAGAGLAATIPQHLKYAYGT
jgi:cadmium resistance protein CadD (predicted permease)